MLRFPGWKIAVILGVCLLGVVLSLPNLFPREQMQRLPDWLPHEQINLGLDLQGGSHLLLEVDIRAVVQERLETLLDDIRSILRPARIGYRGLGVRGDAATLTLTDPASADQAVSLLRDLNPNPLSPEVEIVQGDNGRIDVRLTESAIRDLQDSAVRQSLEIVRRRIDEVGTREPTIQRQGEDRILVQVPGEKDPESIKRLLGQTAKLTFHLVDLDTPVQQALAGNLPPGSELLPSDEAGGGQVVVRKRVEVSGESLIDAQPSFQQNQPVVSFRFDTAGGRKFGNVTREHVGDLLGDRARQQGDQLAADPRADPRRQRRDLRQLHRPERQRARGPAARRRPAGAARDRRGALGRARPRRRLDRRRRDRGHRRPGPRDGADDPLLRPVRGRRLRRAGGQPDPDHGRAVGAAGDADAARHRRHRAHHRHGGRRQRADLRAHPRGGARRPLAARRDRGRLPRGDAHHHRRQSHHADRGGAALRLRLRAGARLRGHARHRHHHLDVHRDQPDPAHGGHVDAPHPSLPRCRSESSRHALLPPDPRRHPHPLHALRVLGVRLLRRAGAADADPGAAQGAQLRHRLPGRDPDGGPGAGRGRRSRRHAGDAGRARARRGRAADLRRAQRRA